MTETLKNLFSFADQDGTALRVAEADGILLLTVTSVAKNASLTVEIDSDAAACLRAALNPGEQDR